MGKWVSKGNWSGDVRVKPWYQNSGGTGESMPANCVALASYLSSNQKRALRLFAYSQQGGDYVQEVKLDDIPFGDKSFPTGRFDPVGVPTVTLHGGQLKIWVAGWAGDGGRTDGVLIRINTQVWWVED